MKRKYRITARRSLRFYALMFMLFGLFLSLLEIHSGWVGRQPWDEAVWRAAFSFVGICGLGAIVWMFPILWVKQGNNLFGLSKIAAANRRPRRSFAEMIRADSANGANGANGADPEPGDEAFAPDARGQEEPPH